ncbi:50S ribosomal protein L23 [Christensenellaceae bacterium OttesenSCG-928-L17]|nr:50S ribosomal protein L23 [Christensenellaceae bacterium OttesenSCG-928-L17]
MILITPRATEKAYAAQTEHTYIFNVPASMSKQSVAKEVAAQFKVTVLSVRISNRKGKATRFRRGKHAYPGTTYRQDKKYAYVTLKEGDKIKVFDEEPVTEEKAKEQKTAIKATDEKQSVETKKAGLFAKRRTGTRGDK